MKSISDIKNRIWYQLLLPRVQISLSRAIASSANRMIDKNDPISWEFSGFSQNGEDGIIDYLSRELIEKNNYFIEIGAGTGIENNTTWLSIVRKFSGIMIEGNRNYYQKCKYLQSNFNICVSTIKMFVTRDNVDQIINSSLYDNPDVLSLDLDGNDYYIMQSLLANGLKPKICILEYNSAFGPDKYFTVEYDPDFDCTKKHESCLYYGASIEAWKTLMGKHNYKFVTVDSNGVNSIFVDPDYFTRDFIDGINGCKYKENTYQFAKFNMKWEKQFDIIKDLPLVKRHDPL